MSMSSPIKNNNKYEETVAWPARMQGVICTPKPKLLSTRCNEVLSFYIENLKKSMAL